MAEEGKSQIKTQKGFLWTCLAVMHKYGQSSPCLFDCGA